jgi:hypothetical protein
MNEVAAQATKTALESPFSTAAKGLTGLTETGGREAFMKSIGGGKGLLKYAAGAAAPMLMAGESESAPPQSDSQRALFAFNPGRVKNPESLYPADYRGERMNFQPQYTRLAAEGGLLDRGTGGSTDDNKYTYDPLTQSYKKVEPPKPTKAGNPDRTMDSVGAGGDLAAAGPGLSGLAAAALASGVGDEAIGAFDTAQSVNALSDASIGHGEVGAINASAMDSMGAAQAADVSGANAASNASGMSADTGTDGIGFYKGGITALAGGGYSHLGDYSDGGRLLRGPGDGVSDSIPATIGNKRPARLADGEFVIPARIVSELGNGSTEAGARKLYAMMNRVQAARGQTTGKGRVAKNTRADKYLPA